MTAKKKTDPLIKLSSKNHISDLPPSAQNPLLSLFLIFMGVTTLFLTLVHHVPMIQTLAFFLGTIVFFLLPGCLVLDLLKWKDNPVSFTILSILTGMAICPILYYLSAIINQTWIFLIIILSASAYVLFRKLSLPDFRAEMISWHLPGHWWKGLLLLTAVLAMLHLSHFSDLAITSHDSYRLRTTAMTETVFHLGIMNVAEHTLPLFYPYASGYSLADYHIDMHLLGVLFTRFLGIDPLVMAYYFLPLLLILMITAVPAVFFYELHKNLNFSLLFGLLIFSSDLSFIPALWMDWPTTYPWTLTFCTTIWSLFTLNGIMPAIPLLFGALTAFQRYFTTNKIRKLIVFALFAIAASRVKSSMGLQIIGTAFPALAFIVWKYRSTKWWRPLGLFTVTALIVFLDMTLRSISSQGGNWIIRWQPFSGLVETAARMGDNGLIVALRNPLDHPLVVIIGLILYVAGFMGVRLISFKYLADIFKKTGTKVYETVPYLIIFMLGGIVLSECIFLGGKNDPINNSVWFRVQSIIAATYFVPAFLLTIKPRSFRYIAVVLVLALSFPSTLQFLSLRHDTVFTAISREEMQLVHFMKGHIPEKAVVFEYPMADRLSPASHLAGRSSVLALFRTFIRACVPIEDIQGRRKDLIFFFSTDDPDAMVTILDKYHADFLLVPAQLSVKYSGNTWLKRIYHNNEWCLYRVE